MNIPSILQMLQAGVHFGHKKSRWHPKMKPFIFTERNGVHVIDLEKTQVKLEEVLSSVKQMAKEGKTILFVTTKPQAKEIVKAAAIDAGMPYLVERWVGGLLTNYAEMKKMIIRYIDLKDQQAKGEFERYTKKEQIELSKKLAKMDISLGGLVSLKDMPYAVFIPSMQREKTAVMEANKTHVKVIGVCDTNSNPNKSDYFIPANDDAVKAVEMIVGLVAQAIKEGKAEALVGKDMGVVAQK